MDVSTVELREGRLPLVVSPKEGSDSVHFLKSWISANKEWLDVKLLEYGAILFQGFAVRDGVEFEEVVQRYNPELCDEYRGTSPRTQVPGTKYVFTASEFPKTYPIPQHLEMSFLPSPPRRLFFCCLEAPTTAGGETCLCDYRMVYETMDPSIRQQFEDKGVKHVRNYHRKKSPGLLADPTMTKGWEEVFGMSSRADVEAELSREGQGFTWRGDDELQIVNKTEAVEKHPQTGDKIWFNHLMVFHWSIFSAEYYRVFRRLGNIRYLLYSWVAWLLRFFFLDLRGPDKVGFHTFFGDGSSIPQGHVTHVHDVVHRNMVFNRWQRGDVLMIDNFRVSHGRQPYTGQRKVVVAWSQPTKRPSLET